MRGGVSEPVGAGGCGEEGAGSLVGARGLLGGDGAGVGLVESDARRDREGGSGWKLADVREGGSSAAGDIFGSDCCVVARVGKRCGGVREGGLDRAEGFGGCSGISGRSCLVSGCGTRFRWRGGQHSSGFGGREIFSRASGGHA